MAKTDRTDKLVGGNKVKADKVAWRVDANIRDVAGNITSSLTLSGESADATQAALDALTARRAVKDAERADIELEEAARSKK